MERRGYSGSGRWGNISNEEAAAAFSSGEEEEDEEEEGAEEAEGVHIRVHKIFKNERSRWHMPGHISTLQK